MNRVSISAAEARLEEAIQAGVTPPVEFRGRKSADVIEFTGDPPDGVAGGPTVEDVVIGFDDDPELSGRWTVSVDEHGRVAVDVSEGPSIDAPERMRGGQ